MHVSLHVRAAAQVWSHHATGAKAVMPHSRCMRCLRDRASGAELGVFESRQILENLMARAVRKRLFPLVYTQNPKIYPDRLGTNTTKAEGKGVFLQVVPSRVYSHCHEAGDVVLIDNWACWHSTTGGLAGEDTRVMLLSAWNGTRWPSAA